MDFIQSIRRWISQLYLEEYQQTCVPYTQTLPYSNRKEYQSDTHSDTILVACGYFLLQEYYKRIEYCHPIWQQATRTGEQEELCKLADKMQQTKENFSNPRLQCVYLNKKRMSQRPLLLQFANRFPNRFHVRICVQIPALRPDRRTGRSPA